MQTQSNTSVANPQPHPDKMHYSQMNVVQWSGPCCWWTTECVVWDMHASTTVYKILLSPGGPHTLVAQFKLLWYEILIQAQIGENMPNKGQHTDSVPKPHKYTLQFFWVIVQLLNKAKLFFVFVQKKKPKQTCKKDAQIVRALIILSLHHYECKVTTSRLESKQITVQLSTSFTSQKIK